MYLKDLIIEILKRGGKLKSWEIAKRASILDEGMPYTKDDVKDIIFKELKHIVNYDHLTYQYFIINIPKSNIKSDKELILETLKINGNPITIIDIAIYIRKNYKKNINIDDILMIIVKDLRFEVARNTDGKLLKYFLR